METETIFSKTLGLSIEYEDIFTKNQKEFCKNLNQYSEKYQNKKYGLFFPSCGTSNKEDIQFIIYGQSSPESNPIFNINDSTDYYSLTKMSRELSNTVQKGVKDTPLGNNPLDWVNETWGHPKKLKQPYRIASSFFWSVVYKLINQYNEYNNEHPSVSRDWCKHMVLSNLLKIARYERVGNPDQIESKAQLKISIELFEKEIKEIKPKYAILLTNQTWACPFLQNMNNIKIYANGFVEVMGNIEKTTIIVTKRPFRKYNNEVNQCIIDILKIINPLRHTLA